MLRSHPFLYIDNLWYSSWNLLVLRCLFEKERWLRMALKVAPEMLKQGYLLLQFFWIYSKSVLPAKVCRVGLRALHVVEMDEIGIQYHLGRIIEENARRFV